MMQLNTPYLIDILEQPNALQRTLDALTAPPELSHFAEDLHGGRLRRIVLTGMGSSFYALHPLWLRLIAAGIEAYALETAELIHSAPQLLSADSLVVAVSQSGESAEMVRLLETTRRQAPVVGVTNSPGSRLAQQAKAVLVTQAGKEFSVSCKTYLATLAALACLGDALLPGESELPSLAAAPLAVQAYLQNWAGYVDQLVALLAEVRTLFLVGRGASLAAALTGGLIIKEAARFPAQGLSSAAFRHGPFEMVAPETFTLVFGGAPQTADLNRRLAGEIQSAGGQAALVQDAAAPGLFDLPVANTPQRTLLEILPAQMLSLALAKLQDIEPGQFRLASKVTRVE